MFKLILYIMMCAAALNTGCRAGTTGDGPIRAAAVAGRFYPAAADELRLAVSRYLDHAVLPKTGRPLAIVVPHAGYVFSGQIAADAFKQAAAYDYDLVVILGTNHTTPNFRGVSVYSQGGFATPLGTAPIAKAAAEQILAADERFTFDPRVHEREHSVEVEIPFVQYLFPKAQIIPIVVGDANLELCEKLGTALAGIAKNGKTLIVASSDLSHYPDYEDAVRVDHETLKAIAALSPAGFQATVRRQMTERVPQLATCACGEAPIMAAMFAAKQLGAVSGTIVSYANSGDASLGESDRVVGYGAVVFNADSGNSVGTEKANTESSVSETDSLTAKDKEALLRYARTTLEWYLTSETTPLARDFSPFAEIPMGAFVTLRKHHQLRGCIGHMAEDMPLCRTVGAMAMMAAFEDRRFSPLTKDELNEIEIEISALTPAKPISDPGQIVLGRDGVILQKDGHSAVFLPQVATEQGWNREQLLDQLCRKAGLSKDCWRSGAILSVFQADVFSESEFGLAR